MKLLRRLTVSSTSAPLVDERVVLELSSPGRAQFLIDASKHRAKPGDAISLDIGYTRHDDLSRLFLGIVENAVDQDAKRQKLFCRELSALLSVDTPLNLRHVSMREVLTQISTDTGLHFSIPDAAYADKKMPNFYNVGSGYLTMDTIPRVFSVDDYVWQQQGDGVIYAGSWADSRYASRPVDLSAAYMAEHLSSNSARVAAIPALRPGVSLNGNRITRLEFSKNSMILTWKK